MSTFPVSAPEIINLAQRIGDGLTAHPEEFPTPPVNKAAMNTLLTSLAEIETAIATRKAELENTFEERLDALSAIVAAMKKDIKYAETLFPNDNETLSLIGWGTRKSPTPTPPPGQTIELSAVAQGPGWVDLVWTAPESGGKVNAYKVQRRLRPNGPWIDVAVAVETNAHVDNQETLKEWEWQVIAVNKAGEGLPSNVIMTVL